MPTPSSSSATSRFSVLTDDPPEAWFADPRLDGPTPITVDRDGRVYGHAALWGTCHTGIEGACVTPPRSASGYAHFLLGGRRTAEGNEVAVGTITLDTRHADTRMTADAARRHYEETGLGIADVAVGEDRWGIWFAGSVRRGVTEPQRDELRAAKVSGDWRSRGGSLELIGMLAVNVPGFPVPRPRTRLAASGGRETLVAANICPRSETVRHALVAGIEAYDREVADQRLDALLLRARLPDLLARARRA